MASRPYGRGPYGNAKFGPGYVELGGVCVVSFDAHGVLGLLWAPAAGCNAGTWEPMAPCRGAGIVDTVGYSDGAYNDGPWPHGVVAPWEPVGPCDSGSWTKTRLPALEPA